MNKTWPVVAMLLLSFIGIADSWYLAQSAMTDTPLICDINVIDGCNTVAQSPYSQFMGIPLGVYGVAFYAIVFVLVAALYTITYRPLTLFLGIITSIGALASLYFLYIQFFLIEATCIYCLVSAGTSFVLVLLAWSVYKQPGSPIEKPVVH